MARDDFESRVYNKCLRMIFASRVCRDGFRVFLSMGSLGPCQAIVYLKSLTDEDAAGPGPPQLRDYHGKA